MKEDEILEQLRLNDKSSAIKYLYKEFPKIKANICASGGNKEISEELFNDALVIMIEKVNSPSFVLTSKVSTYLFGIVRLLWKNELRKQKKKYELEWNDTLIVSEDDIDYDSEREMYFKEMEVIIKKLSNKCQLIFERFYYKKESMKNIANALGFSSVNSAKTQKYKCMERSIKLANEFNLKISKS